MYGRSLMVRLGTVLIIIELSWWSYYTTGFGCFLSSMMSVGCLVGCIWNKSALGCGGASLFHGWVVCGGTHCWFSIGFWGYRGCGRRCLCVQRCCGLILPLMLAVSAKGLSGWSLHYIWSGFNTSLCNNCRGPFTFNLDHILEHVTLLVCLGGFRCAGDVETFGMTAFNTGGLLFFLFGLHCWDTLLVSFPQVFGCTDVRQLMELHGR